MTGKWLQQIEQRQDVPHMLLINYPVMKEYIRPDRQHQDKLLSNSVFSELESEQYKRMLLDVCEAD